jgi:hypothetical protein
MRRLVAHLALAAVYASFFAPLVAAQEMPEHACCRRAGLHHCQTTNEAGFHSKTNPCPYSTPLPSSTIFGLEPAAFRVQSPATTGVLAQHSSLFDIAVRVGDLSARAPPTSFL